MGPYRSYEIQTYAHDAWRIESICDDPEIAIFEAKRLFRRGFCLAVRVVEECSNPTNNDAVVRTIFRMSNAEKPKSPASARAYVVAGGTRRVRARAVAADEGDESYLESNEAGSVFGPVFMVLFMATIVLCGIGTILALRAYFGVA